MNFVFFEDGRLERIIRRVLSDHLQTQGQAGTFYVISAQGNCLPKKERDAENLIFYRIYVPYELEKTRKFMKVNCICAKIVALCRNDKDGIEAMGKGSDYALLLPLSPEMILHCYSCLQPSQSI